MFSTKMTSESFSWGNFMPQPRGSEVTLPPRMINMLEDVFVLDKLDECDGLNRTNLTDGTCWCCRSRTS